MKKLFENLNYFLGKVSIASVADDTVTGGDYALAEAAYKTIQDLVAEAENEIIAKYGSLENVGIDYELGVLKNLFDLLDNHLYEIPSDMRKTVKYYLCSDMCTRVRYIAERYDTIDQEMAEHYKCSRK
jgi:hypothetical protein